MFRNLFSIGLLAMASALAFVPYVEAQSSSSSSSSSSGVGYDACREEMDWRAWKEQREFRAVLFGLTNAEKAIIAEVRFATQDKSIWIKTQRATSSTSSTAAQPSIWESVSPGFESTTWPDNTMDTFNDVAPRSGIFGVQRRLSTELIPNLAQAYRTLECKLEQLCRLVDMSLTVEEPAPQTVTVKILGCQDVATTTIPFCHLPVEQELVTTQGNLKAYCIAMTESLRLRETQVLKLVSEYDAGYRTGLQFSGIFRSFLAQMRGVVLGSIRSSTQMITSFSRVPCFIGACDDNPSSLDSSSSPAPP